MENNKYGDQSIRVFENDLLEALTHVHPITPLIVWTPVTGYFLYQGFNDGYSYPVFFLIILFGILAWTLLEYVAHRFLFHFPAKGKIGKKLVFLFHGIHHDAPNDKTRLVFPPVPAIVIMTLLYSLMSLFIKEQMMNTYFAGFLIGYLCYDYIHYATHHFPMTNPIGRYLRKYHLQHHFSHDHSKYGVSSPLWDIVFRSGGKR